MAKQDLSASLLLNIIQDEVRIAAVEEQNSLTLVMYRFKIIWNKKKKKRGIWFEILLEKLPVLFDISNIQCFQSCIMV